MRIRKIEGKNQEEDDSNQKKGKKKRGIKKFIKLLKNDDVLSNLFSSGLACHGGWLALTRPSH